jgi:type-F conjugative transfer system secretin TraK
MKKCGFLLMLFISLRVSAHQRIPVQEDSLISAYVSTEALNRIAVENDRIMGIKGTSGQFEMDKDAELGQIFIKPILSDKDEPIHVFITTEKGHTYSLSLISNAEGGAESIVLVPAEAGIAAALEKSGSYESALKEIIKAMHTQSALEGFAVENAKLKHPKIRGAQVSHVQSYSGSKLLGQILEVYNSSTEEIFLTETDFYSEGVRAVAIIDKVLPAKGKTRVYLVRT